MKKVTQFLIGQTAAAARAAPRQRSNHNLHPELADPVQRFLNAIEPGSYVRPHRHAAPPRWELFVALAGRAVVLLFDEQGGVLERAELSPGGELQAVELPEACWHTLAALEPGTVLLEIKQGPYVPLRPEDFAAWAPAEGERACAEFVEWYWRAQPGERAPV